MFYGLVYDTRTRYIAINRTYTETTESVIQLDGASIQESSDYDDGGHLQKANRRASGSLVVS
jgi:hypothetical protein